MSNYSSNLILIGSYFHSWSIFKHYREFHYIICYLDTIPKSLDEAARIDGASHFRIFRQIVLPIAKPIITFLGITSFTGPWMDWIFPKLVLRSSEKQTLALGLFTFVSDKKNDFTTFAAGALIVTIPFVFFFMLTQNTLITSFGGAAVKE